MCRKPLGKTDDDKDASEGPRTHHNWASSDPWPLPKIPMTGLNVSTLLVSLLLLGLTAQALPVCHHSLREMLFYEAAVRLLRAGRETMPGQCPTQLDPASGSLVGGREV